MFKPGLRSMLGMAMVLALTIVGILTISTSIYSPGTTVWYSNYGTVSQNVTTFSEWFQGTFGSDTLISESRSTDLTWGESYVIFPVNITVGLILVLFGYLYYRRIEWVA